MNIDTITRLMTVIFLFLLAFVIQTKNFKSSMVFKFIPFVLGVFNLLVLLGQLGILNL